MIKAAGLERADLYYALETYIARLLQAGLVALRQSSSATRAKAW
jgi:hypothetical protein